MTTDNITPRVRAGGNGESAYSAEKTGSQNETSFMNNGNTTNLSLTGITLNWTQTGSPNDTDQSRGHRLRLRGHRRDVGPQRLWQNRRNPRTLHR